MTATKGLHIIAGMLLALITIAGLMAFDLIDTPTEMLAEHERTKALMDVEWGIRTFPQEDQ